LESSLALQEGKGQNLLKIIRSDSSESWNQSLIMLSKNDSKKADKHLPLYANGDISYNTAIVPELTLSPQTSSLLASLVDRFGASADRIILFGLRALEAQLTGSDPVAADQSTCSE
jgi:hypothetical protein